MLDPIIAFFVSVFEWIGRGIGTVIAAIMWPFVAFGRWYKRRSWLLKGPIGILLLALIAFYGYFIYHTQRWNDFDPDYATKYDFSVYAVTPGASDPAAPSTCGQSAIIHTAADLTNYTVNVNNWVPATLAYKMGFFGIAWKNTPFLDNKAAFELGINEIIRRVAQESVDRLGRLRGTSQIDQDLQDARQSVYYNEDFWYFSLDPFGPKSPTPTSYRSAVKALNAFNDRLGSCKATFDPRADNLLRFLDQMSNAIGSTSDILNDRINASNAGWFDFRADDRFWFTYGQLYALNGIMAAARSDFRDVVTERNVTKTWDEMTVQLRNALDMRPWIISNGGEASFLMPSHLATMGFYLLRVRANITEMRDILDR